MTGNINPEVDIEEAGEEEVEVITTIDRKETRDSTRLRKLIKASSNIARKTTKEIIGESSPKK